MKENAIELLLAAKAEHRELTPEEEELVQNAIKAKEEEEKPAEEPVEEKPAEEAPKEEEEKSCEEPEKQNVKEEKSNTKNQIMEKRFSIIKTIRSQVNNTPLDELTQAVLNAGEVQARQAGIAAQGICLPVEARDVTPITVTAEGEDIVATELWDILMPLRKKSIMAEAGVKFYDGLVGNVQIPTMTAGNVNWEGETAAASGAGETFGHVTLSPKRISAVISVSKQLLAQDSIGVEMALRADLSNALAQKIEESFFSNFSGSTTQPEGVYHAISATSVSAFTDVCDLEAVIDDANVMGENVYCLSNKAKSALRSMAKGSKSTQLVYENGNVDGTKALNSSVVGSGKTYVYGDFSSVAVGLWGTEILTDPYTEAGNGCVRIVLNAYVDFKLTRPTALAVGSIA